MNNVKKKPCVWCVYARMREDICATYCTGGFDNKDGTCEHFKEYLTREEKKDGIAPKR